MGFTPQVFIIMLAFTVFSCGSSGEQTANSKAADSTAQQLKTENDTMPKPEPVPPPPAPGTVRLKGAILSVDTTKNAGGLIIHFKVYHTLAYGSATPAIAPQDTLEISASLNQEMINSEDEVTLLIQHRDPPVGFGETPPAWQLMNIEKNKNQK